MNPYAPPQVNPYASFFHYSPLGWKTTASVIGIIGIVVLPTLQSVIGVAAGDRLTNPVPENVVPILLNGLLALVVLGFTVLTWIFFLLWMNHAAKNIRAFGQQALTVTPGMAVAWWFIPIASMWMPFVAMREIWKASDPETVGPNARPWMTAPVPATLGAWWGVYMLNGFVAIFATLANFDFSGRVPVAQAAHTPGVVTFVSHGLYGVAGILVILILRQVAKRQELAWQRLTSQPSAPPPGPPSPSHAPANPYLPADQANPYLLPPS